MSDSDLIYHMRINNTGKLEKYEVSCRMSELTSVQNWKQLDRRHDAGTKDYDVVS